MHPALVERVLLASIEARVGVVSMILQTGSFLFFQNEPEALLLSGFLDYDMNIRVLALASG